MLKTISSSKVPLVFHASELDLMLTMKQFFLEELPPTLEEFKDVTLATFPCVFDTLLMARNQPLKSNFVKSHVLGEIYKKCQEQDIGSRIFKYPGRASCGSNKVYRAALLRSFEISQLIITQTNLNSVMTLNQV